MRILPRAMRRCCADIGADDARIARDVIDRYHARFIAVRCGGGDMVGSGGQVRRSCQGFRKDLGLIRKTRDEPLKVKLLVE